MGASNVAAAFTWWGHLDDKPMRLLLYMAVTTHDRATETQSARLYYGGWEPLATLGLGRRMPPEPYGDDDSPAAAEARRARHAARVAATDGITKLLRAGAITVLRDGRNGQRANYLLHLEPPTKGQGEPVTKGQGEPVTKGQGEPVTKGQGEPVTKGQGEPVPKEEQRKNRGVPQERDRLGLATHVTDRPGSAEDLIPLSAASPAARALLAQVTGRRATPAPWCGHCNEATRMVWNEGRPAGRCPRCGPVVAVVS